MDVAELKQSQRLRILNALETIRDEAMALAGLCLIAARGVRENDNEAANRLMQVIGICQANARLANEIAVTMN